MAERQDQIKSIPRPDSPRDTVDIIFDSAREAFGSALVVWLLGGVAISIASGFAGGMVPALPPGFEGGKLPAAARNHAEAWWEDWHGGLLALFFAISFIHALWVNFRHPCGKTGRRIKRLLYRIRKDWFSIIVGNAITAWVTALILNSVQSFSLSHLFWQWLMGIIQPYLQRLGHFLLEESAYANMSAWVTWFFVNEAKLNFWILYLGGMFDDLGVPNFKALARWIWRRLRRKEPEPLPPAAEPAKY